MATILNVILTLVTSSYCIYAANKTCNLLKIGEHWFEREIVWSHLGRPYNLNVHKSTNMLFFSYSFPETYSDVDFQLACFDMDNKAYQIIAGIKGGCTIAIDQDGDEIYLGGSDGIYKFNMLTKLADVYLEEGKNVWSLFYKKYLFYINYPNQKLHIYIEGKFSNVREFENFEVDLFYLTNDNEIYFSNKSGLFKFNSVQMKAEILNEMIYVRQISEDNEETLYICTNDGIYTDTKLDGLKKIVRMKNMYGLTFDRDNNMIYSDDNSIYLLRKSKLGCTTEPHW